MITMSTLTYKPNKPVLLEYPWWDLEVDDDTVSFSAYAPTYSNVLIGMNVNGTNTIDFTLSAPTE